VKSPEPSQVGKNFQELGAAAGQDPVEVFMDLMAKHGSDLRWKTVVGNDRDGPRHKLLKNPGIIPGFNDSGAHNQQMAFQDGTLQLLQQVVLNPHIMTIEHAIYRQTGEVAEYLGVDAGTIRVGDHADLVVIDPEKLKTGLSEPIEHYDDDFGGSMRLVRRSDGVVKFVAVGGKAAMDENGFVDSFGKERFGRLLRAQRKG
jgi:N-acyl-D-aspartate/D-glutamate deacylase